MDATGTRRNARGQEGKGAGEKKEVISIEIRCGCCNRKLFDGEGDPGKFTLKTICGRCKRLVYWRAGFKVARLVGT